MHAALVSLGQVSFMGCVLLVLAKHDLFQSAAVDTSLSHYAERAATWWPWPDIVPMPLNAVVNVGYVLVGFYWLRRLPQLGLSRAQQDLIYPWIWLCTLYAPIQLLRVVTLSQYWAVLDQWFTLPMFAWAAAGSYTFPWLLEDEQKAPTGVRLRWLAVTTSALAYLVAPLHPLAYDLVLAIVIPTTVFLGVRTTMYCWTPETTRALVAVIGWLSVFIVPKVLDLHLAAIHPAFTLLSGHCISKVGDFMQIHYCCVYAERVIKQRQQMQKVRWDWIEGTY